MKKPIVVIKYGGSLLEDPKKQKIFLDQIATEWGAKRHQILLVHGGGKEITRQMEKAELETKIIEGRRFTDEKGMTIVENTLRKINNVIVNQLKDLKVEAIGYSGKENNWLKSRVDKKWGRVGIPDHADYNKLLPILEQQALPVFYSVGADENGESLNINADDFAMVLAVGIGADELIFLTDTGGVLDESGQVILQINPESAIKLISNGTITKGMVVKIQACLQALSRVGKITIGEAVLSDAQGLHVTTGTTIVKTGPTVRR